METAVVVAAVAQGITAVVIAVATIVYTRVTLRMFQAGIEPNISVDLTGSANDNLITVHNDAGCRINDLTVSVLVGTTKKGISFGIRRCIFQHTWPTLFPGMVETTKQSPISELAIHGDDDNLPEDVESNPHDLVVNYSFVRSADSRRYNYQYQIGFVRNPDGTTFYLPLAQPETVRHNK
jgi:hypothetical protein